MNYDGDDDYDSDVDCCRDIDSNHDDDDDDDSHDVVDDGLWWSLMVCNYRDINSVNISLW